MEDDKIFTTTDRKAHPMSGNNGNGKKPGGVWEKAIAFAKENPILAVMAGMVALAIIMPEKKK